jgi:predicted AAA+ superfamily ATPase
MYPRILQNQIEQWINKREIIVVYGARQVGKTTLLKLILRKKKNSLILNCELPSVATILESRDMAAIRHLFGNHRIVGLDEAQKVHDIGKVLKLIYDELPEYKIIATGSSSFDLANKLTEPLTGRNIKFILYALSLEEIKLKKGWLNVMQNIGDILVYGSYPGIIDLNDDEKKLKLELLGSDYLYQDILIYDSIKNSSVLRKLLKLLAFQVGSQLSTNELSVSLGINRPTVEKYLDLLEKCFVIFSLGSLSGNLRNEIKKSKKYYFYDNGLLNSITGNYSPINNRSDYGALWENFCISERLKQNVYHQEHINFYFWRTYDGAEVDLVEEKNGKYRAWEFKWNKRRKPLLPDSFRSKYQPVDYQVVSPEKLHLLLTHEK